MLKPLPTLAALAALFSTTAAIAAERGATVFAESCSACHLETLSAEETATAESLAAPPMNLLTTIIRKKTQNSKTAFVDHVIDFAVQPSREKVKAMAEAVDRFGLMPPIGETAPTVAPDDLHAVANWLYSHYDFKTELRQLEDHQREEAQNGSH